jgi:hypothetical protein
VAPEPVVAVEWRSSSSFGRPLAGTARQRHAGPAPVIDDRDSRHLAKMRLFPVVPGDKSLPRLQNSRTRPTEHGTMLKKFLLPFLLPSLSTASVHILSRKNRPHWQPFAAPDRQLEQKAEGTA